MVTLTDRLNWNKAWDIPSRFLPTPRFPPPVPANEYNSPAEVYILILPCKVCRSVAKLVDISLDCNICDGISFVHRGVPISIIFFYVYYDEVISEFLNFSQMNRNDDNKVFFFSNVLA